MYCSRTGHRRQYGAARCMVDTEGYKHIPSEYLILTAFLLQQWLHELVSLLRYKYIAVWFRSVYSKANMSILNSWFRAS